MVRRAIDASDGLGVCCVPVLLKALLVPIGDDIDTRCHGVTGVASNSRDTYTHGRATLNTTSAEEIPDAHG